MDADLQLMLALQAGDDSALDELINRHREPLHRFVYRYLNDEAATADVVEETFVRIYFKAASFRPKSSVKTWIYAIAVNLCRDRFRRLARHGIEVPIDRPSRPEQRPLQIPDRRPLPYDCAADADEFALLRHAIDSLPQALREVIVLFALEQRSQREVAELLGISPKAVETRVYHAKAKLRAALGSAASDA